MAQLDFKSFTDYNEFMKNLAKPGRVVKLIKPIYGSGGQSGKYSMNMQKPGEISYNITGIGFTPEAIFRDGTSVKIDGNTYLNFAIAHRDYGINGVS